MLSCRSPAMRDLSRNPGAGPPGTHRRLRLRARPPRGRSRRSAQRLPAPRRRPAEPLRTPGRPRPRPRSDASFARSTASAAPVTAAWAAAAAAFAASAESTARPADSAADRAVFPTLPPSANRRAIPWPKASVALGPWWVTLYVWPVTLLHVDTELASHLAERAQMTPHPIGRATECRSRCRCRPIDISVRGGRPRSRPGAHRGARGAPG